MDNDTTVITSPASALEIPAKPELLARRQGGSLAGKMLVATPVLQESCFARSVIFMCAHNGDGAMGIIVNYPVANVSIGDVMEQLRIKNNSDRELPIHFGGPVDSNRGFIIHSDDFIVSGTTYQPHGVVVTSSSDVLQAVANGGGPRQGMLALGYAGWTAGQLESEMESGSWIVVEANRQLIFDTDNGMKWGLAISSLGFDVGNFSTVVGHA